VTPRALARVAGAESGRYLAELRTYYPDVVSDMIVTSLIVVVFVLSSDRSSDPAYYVGFLYWSLGSSVISEAAVSIATEKQMGTFTQLSLRPVPTMVLVGVKTSVWLVVNALKVIVVLGALFLVLGVPLGFQPLMVPAAAITLTGLFGFTLVLVGLAVVYTKTSGFQSVISYVLLFATGAVIPKESLPGAIATFGAWLPLTQGISLSRDLISGATVTATRWGLLAFQSAALLGIGYMVFSLVMRRGRRRGINMRY
jgi:ABC-2 type transport system permease protein